MLRKKQLEELEKREQLKREQQEDHAWQKTQKNNTRKASVIKEEYVIESEKKSTVGEARDKTEHTKPYIKNDLKPVELTNSYKPSDFSSKKAEPDVKKTAIVEPPPLPKVNRVYTQNLQDELKKSAAGSPGENESKSEAYSNVREEEAKLKATKIGHSTDMLDHSRLEKIEDMVKRADNKQIGEAILFKKDDDLRGKENDDYNEGSTGKDEETKLEKKLEDNSKNGKPIEVMSNEEDRDKSKNEKIIEGKDNSKNIKPIEAKLKEEVKDKSKHGKNCKEKENKKDESESKEENHFEVKNIKNLLFSINDVDSVITVDSQNANRLYSSSSVGFSDKENQEDIKKDDEEQDKEGEYYEIEDEDEEDILLLYEKIENGERRGIERPTTATLPINLKGEEEKVNVMRKSSNSKKHKQDKTMLV